VLPDEALARVRRLLARSGDELLRLEPAWIHQRLDMFGSWTAYYAVTAGV
jgi:hypothetical protein